MGLHAYQLGCRHLLIPPLFLLVYHHTLVLTFRPFLVLRAKLRQEDVSSNRTATDSSGLPAPPPWLDTACEYCLDATRHCIVFLGGACEQNVLCRVGKPCDPRIVLFSYLRLT